MVNGSHKVDALPGDKIVIRDLELFVGFDPSIDDGSDEGVKKYTREKIAEVVQRTGEFMNRDQRPKLVVNHDKEGEPASDETVGDIVKIATKDIHGAPGIVGDVEMSRADFDSLIKSNRFPRRSAEIWSDGLMSEVALLGRDTPRRPLPDTKFNRHGFKREVFTRAWPLERFAEPTNTMHAPGPGNVYIPHEVDDMDDKMKCELEDTKKKLAEANAKLATYEKGDDDKTKDLSTRLAGIEHERDEFKRAAEAQAEKTTKLQTELRQEKFGRKIDEMANQGYRIGDRAKLLERVVGAVDPDAELVFLKSLMSRDPLNKFIDQSNTTTGDGAAPKSQEAQVTAREKAVDRCTREGANDKFSVYYAEELAKV